VLKAPQYLSLLPAFFAEYPDAHVVVTHRDPLKVMPSLTDLMATLVWMHSDTVPYDRIVRSAVFGTAAVLDLVSTWRENGTVPDDRIVDVRYDELVADPWTTLHHVYERTGSRLTPEAEQTMREYLDAKPQGRHGRHEYAFADLGLDLDETRARFAGYVARYGIPEE
jgi:hypothetical protein